MQRLIESITMNIKFCLKNFLIQILVNQKNLDLIEKLLQNYHFLKLKNINQLTGIVILNLKLDGMKRLLP